MNKILKFINPNLLLSLVFLNYLIYFFFNTKFLFLFFSILIVSIFIYVIFFNLKLKSYIILILFVLSIITLGSPLSDWDSRSIWFFNAKRIFYNENLNDYTNYLGSEFSHLDYPILIQTLSASLATLIGKWNEVFPKFSTIIFSLPALLIISNITNNKLNKLILAILILFVYEKRMINGDMDAILGLYTISSAILLISFYKLDKVKFEDYFTLFLFLSSLTMIKVEGLCIFFCLLIGHLIVFHDFKKPKNNILLLTFLISLIPIILWRNFIYDQNVTSSSYLLLSNGNRLLDNLLDFKFLLVLIKSIILNKQMFISIIIFLLLLSKYISFNKKKLSIKINTLIFEKRLIFLFIVITFYSIILFLIFVMSEGSPNNVPGIKYFMTVTSADRLFLPIHSLLILCSIYFNKLSKKF